MIKLKVQPYCENCPHFEAETETHEICDDFKTIRCETTVRCSNAEKCERIKNHLRNEERRNWEERN